jgi:hypothetical protein
MSNREVTFTMAQVQRYETIQAAIEQRMTAGEAAHGPRGEERGSRGPPWEGRAELRCLGAHGHATSPTTAGRLWPCHP